MDRYDHLIATTVMQDVSEAGITLAAREGKLRITGPQPPSWLLDGITRHRAALLSLLEHSVAIDTDTTQQVPGVAELCQSTFRESDDWQLRRHDGRTVYFDPECHDGSLIWPDVPKSQNATSAMPEPDDLAGWSAKRGRPVQSAKAPPAARVDAVRMFIASECEVGATRCVGADELFAAYQAVAGSKCPLDRQQLARVLVHLGYQGFAAAGMRWRGLALIKPPAHYAQGGAA